jgi:hypothetical protein
LPYCIAEGVSEEDFEKAMTEESDDKRFWRFENGWFLIYN